MPETAETRPERGAFDGSAADRVAPRRRAAAAGLTTHITR